MDPNLIANPHDHRLAPVTPIIHESSSKELTYDGTTDSMGNRQTVKVNLQAVLNN